MLEAIVATVVGGVILAGVLGAPRVIAWWQRRGKPPLNRHSEAITAIFLNVASTNKRLRDIIDHVIKGNFTSPETRGALDETRTEFLQGRASWVVIEDTDLMQAVEHWHDEVRRVKDEIANEERAWTQFMNTSPMHPPEMMILPAKKRLGEYQGLLTKGEELERGIQKLREPKPPATPPPSEERRARDRLATRLMLLSGQFDTLGHWLRHLGSLDRIENVLVDIEKLAEGHSHADLDVMGDAEFGKVVIAYYRDVRGSVQDVRKLAKTFDRLRAMSDREQRLESSLTHSQAYAAQCSREGQQLAEKLTPASRHHSRHAGRAAAHQSSQLFASIDFEVWRIPLMSLEPSSDCGHHEVPRANIANS